MNQHAILAIIPARGGSKGIKGKNIVNCAGKPLLYWTAKSAHESSLIGKCILSSDDENIIKKAQELNIQTPFIRPKYLAEDDTPSLFVVKHALKWVLENNYYNPDIVVLLQPTSPLRTSRHIDEAIQLLINDSEADSVVSVVTVPHNYSVDSIMCERDGYLIPWKAQNEVKNIRQLKKEFVARNGAAIYAFRTKTMLDQNSIYGKKIIPYHMSQEESVDVDTAFELKICEMLLSQEIESEK